MNKYKEFWFYPNSKGYWTVYDNPLPNGEDLKGHAIDYAALEAAQKRISELEAECVLLGKQKANANLVRDAWIIAHPIVKAHVESLESKLKIAVEALESIQKAYPMSGERMAHQDYAQKALAQIKDEK